jgi:hypothetical protein
MTRPRLFTIFGICLQEYAPTPFKGRAVNKYGVLRRFMIYRRNSAPERQCETLNENGLCALAPHHCFACFECTHSKGCGRPGLEIWSKSMVTRTRRHEVSENRIESISKLLSQRQQRRASLLKLIVFAHVATLREIPSKAFAVFEMACGKRLFGVLSHRHPDIVRPRHSC